MERLLHTCFRSVVCVTHFPGSHNIVQRKVKTTTVDNIRNALCMTGLLGMSGDWQGENERRSGHSDPRKHTISKPSNPRKHYPQHNSKMEAKPVWAVLQVVINSVPF